MSRPESPHLALARLLVLATRAQADLEDERRWGLRPVMHTDVRGEAQEARLRVALPNTPKGLLRFEVVQAAQSARGGWATEPAVLLVTREDSAADRALEARFPGTSIHKGSRRVARQITMTGSSRETLARTIAPILESLAACPNELGANTTPAGNIGAALAVSA